MMRGWFLDHRGKNVATVIAFHVGLTVGAVGGRAAGQEPDGGKCLTWRV